MARRPFQTSPQPTQVGNGPFRRNIRERRFEPGDLENVKRGMQPYDDPESGLFCIANDIGDVLVIGDTSGGDVTFTLPSANAAVNVTYYVKRTTGGTNNLNVISSSGNIDGTATVGISTQYTCLQIRSDGTDWWVV